jgi:polygalacturonase
MSTSLDLIFMCLQFTKITLKQLNQGISHVTFNIHVFRIYDNYVKKINEGGVHMSTPLHLIYMCLAFTTITYKIKWEGVNMSNPPSFNIHVFGIYNDYIQNIK